MLLILRNKPARTVKGNRQVERHEFILFRVGDGRGPGVLDILFMGFDGLFQGNPSPCSGGGASIGNELTLVPF